MEHIRAVTAKLVTTETVPTIGVHVETERGASGVATLPSGISVGAGEAQLAPVEQAIRTINELVAPAMIGKDCLEQREVDLILMNLDGTPNRARLGANSLLPVSLAIARAAAAALHRELYEHIADLTNTAPSAPEIISVVVEGGKHGASEALAAQELSLIGLAERVESLLIAITGEFQRRNIPVQPGREGGLAPLANDAQVIDAVRTTLMQPSWRNAQLALDLAATHHQSTHLLGDYTAALPIVLVEDPLPDDDQEGWATFTREHGTTLTIAADDLALGNPMKIKDAVRQDLANCLVVKLNQTATLSELFDLIALVQVGNWQHIVSHRGNEVPDDFIVDLAVGTGAHYLKLGTPRSSVRVPKFSRLKTITAQLARSSWSALQS